MQDESQLHTLVFCCNRGFLAPLSAAILSVVQTFEQPETLRIVIGHTDIGEDDQHELKSWVDGLTGTEHCQLRWVDPVLLKDFPITMYFTPEANLRFYLLEELSHTCRRALYLDADMIALKNIQPLFDIDLEGKVFGAVQNPDLTGMTTLVFPLSIHISTRGYCWLIYSCGRGRRFSPAPWNCYGQTRLKCFCWWIRTCSMLLLGITGKCCPRAGIFNANTGTGCASRCAIAPTKSPPLAVRQLSCILTDVLNPGIDRISRALSLEENISGWLYKLPGEKRT